MKLRHTCYIAMACSGMLTAASSLCAQTAESRMANDAIVIEDKKIEISGGSLVVGMRLNMEELRLKSDNRLVFTPVVRSGSNEKVLPQIVVNGRKQDISYRRSGGKGFAGGTVSVRRKNGTRQSVDYKAVVEYEDWMKNSDVVIAEDLCGCGDVKEQDRTVVGKLRTPLMPYMRPEAEARKARAEQGRAFIDFPVDKTTLYPDYRNNPRELDKIVSTINLVNEDKNVTITGIEIHGYASPESPYTHNADLASGRAATLKEHVRRLVRLDNSLFTVRSTPEDWDGLREAVEGSNLDNKNEILAIINDGSLEPDARERRIKDRYPEDYRFMLDTYYPALRHSDYTVRYTVRPFSVEEAKEVMKTKPQQLSLEEMFLVAQTYEPGSVEFNEVMETAVRMYPDDPTANINAACSHMEAGSSARADHARGVLEALKGNSSAAETLLRKAAQGGAEGAQRNLDLLTGDAM